MRSIPALASHANKKPIAPIQPPSSITLNLLSIPPYPSYPFALSSDQISYLDTKIGNEKLLNTRYKKYQVSQRLTADLRQQLQPRAYKMTDIGQLERRIRDLEYYVSMSLAESSMNAQFIGSSADSTLNRYKFGFYVDTFVDANLSEVDNPQYSCTIVENRLVPRMEQIVIPGVPINPTPPGPPVTPIEPEDCTEEPDDSDGEFTQVIKQYIDYATEDYGDANTDGTQFEVHDRIEFSNTAGQVSMYIDVPDARYVVEVYQSPNKRTRESNLGVTTANSTLVITSASSVALSDQEKLDRSIPLVKYQTFVSPTTVGTYNNVIGGASKLSWSHSTVNGRFYTIVVRRITDIALNLNDIQRKNSRRDYDNRGKLILNYPADVKTKKLERTIRVDKIQYRGHCHTKDDIRIDRPHKDDRRIRPMPALPWVHKDQKITMRIAGLRPGTKHNFLIDGQNMTNSVAQRGKSVTADLISDEYGIIELDYFYGTGKSVADSEFAASARDASSTGSSTKTVVISSDDNTSTARTTLMTPEYTTDYVNTTNESSAVLQPTTDPSIVESSNTSQMESSAQLSFIRTSRKMDI
jgi:hypothetical protein